MSHNMNLIEHPEPDFDLEAELPAELAALAEQLTADADFLIDRYPADSTQQAEPQQTKPQSLELPSAGSTSQSGRNFGVRWWLRAAAIVMMLTGLGSALNRSHPEPTSCEVAGEAIDQTADPAAVAVAPRHLVVAEAAPVVRVAPVVDVAPARIIPATFRATAVAPQRTFDAFTSAEQEAVLDLNTSLLDASVSF